MVASASLPSPSQRRASESKSVPAAFALVQSESVTANVNGVDANAVLSVDVERRCAVLFVRHVAFVINNMTPGVADEAGKTARTVVDALKSTPGVLALVLFNLAFIALIAWIQHQNGQRWERLMTETLKNCAAVHETK